MNKKFILSVFALFVVSMIAGIVIHGTLLGADYQALGPVMRPPEDAQGYFGWMLAAHLIMAVGLTGIYRRGHEAGKPWLGQGVRFGMWMALVVTVAIYLIYYAVQPMPGMLVAKQIIFGSIAMVVMGTTFAAVNR
jgi:cation transporter-like permease